MRLSIMARWRFTPVAMLCIVVALGCRTPREPATFDHCERNPPDSVPPPPIDVKATADSAGVLFVRIATSGPAASLVAVLDGAGASARDGIARFSGVNPGSHRLRIRSFGYGDRDTVITVPPDSALHVNVTLTPGGGLRGCSTYIIEKE